MHHSFHQKRSKFKRHKNNAGGLWLSEKVLKPNYFTSSLVLGLQNSVTAIACNWAAWLYRTLGITRREIIAWRWFIDSFSHSKNLNSVFSFRSHVATDLSLNQLKNNPRRRFFSFSTFLLGLGFDWWKFQNTTHLWSTSWNKRWLRLKAA